MEDTTVMLGVGMLAGAIFFLDGWGPSDKSKSFMKSRRFRGLAVLVGGGILSPVLDHAKDRKLDFLLSYIQGCLWGWLFIFAFCAILYVSWKWMSQSESKKFQRYSEFPQDLLDFIYYGIADNPHLEAERSHDLERKQIINKNALERLRTELEQRDIAVPLQQVTQDGLQEKPPAKIDERSREMLESYYSELIRTKPEASFTFHDWYYKGILEFDKEEYSVAIGSLTSALQKGKGSYDDRARAHQFILMAYVNSKEYDKAIAIAQAVLTLFPATVHRGEIYDWLGRAYYFSGQYDAAITAYDEALKLFPGHAIVSYNKGLALAALENYEDALLAYEKALEADPGYSDAWNNKACILAELGRNEDALDACEKALAITPGFILALKNKYMLTRNLKRFDVALSVLEELFELKQDDADTWNEKGRMHGELQQHEEALAAFEQAIALRGDFEAALNNKRIALEHLGRSLEAVEAD